MIRLISFFIMYTLSKCPGEMCPGGFPQSIILLKLSPRFQIMPPRSIIKEFCTPVIKKLYARLFLEKLVVFIETQCFQHDPRSLEYFCNSRMRFRFKSSTTECQQLSFKLQKINSKVCIKLLSHRFR